ncbi:heavy metal translocating P-type ATPase [Martelella sp. HB161492]|uniref:heavy metal translocating P-type ATPase n=1 Tax=Martelella sp. HB161492 TaxID=2720726 RepID=UPI0015928475|nr:heavy metal translocating P-type ATPase [Martelella sp. HB161492]
MVQTANRMEWQVKGMDCASCVAKVRHAVERVPGVSNVDITLMSERLRADIDPANGNHQAVEKAVRALGYSIAASDTAGPAPQTADHGHAHDCSCDHHHHHDDGHGDAHSHSHDEADAGQSWYQTSKGRLVLLTATLLALAWIAELTLPILGLWPFVLASLVGLAPVAKRAFLLLRTGQPFTIESLMTVAAVGALFIGAAEEAALVVFLFAVGEVLEGVAANRARAGIRSLAELVPKTAQLEIDGTTRDVPASSLVIGQAVLVRPGERIPADGDVVEGISGVDESPVTGESVPVTKQPGSPVYAGSVNAEAALRVSVTKAPEDNTIARIIRLVEEAESARAPTERFIDRFSRYYMPVIVGLAFLTIILPPLLAGQPWDTWIYRGLALLLIGCPCALVISVPASIASALSAGARHGLLVKGGAAIEATAKIRHVAFDKTGTLTRGTPQVTDIIALALDETELLRLASAVEAGSSHPLALAILARAEASCISVPSTSAAKALPGEGAEARLGETLLRVVKPDFARRAGCVSAAVDEQISDLEAAGKTTVAVLRNETLAGLIALRDDPRPDAGAAIAALTAMGISSVMLTGDNERTAKAIASELGIAAKAGMMPDDKLAAIRAMTEEGVIMVGDGINDAPALKQANVGVAMGSGTDVAMETADAAILRSRVTDIPALIRLSRAAMGNIRQNISLALGLKAIFLVTSILGITGLWIAIMADTGATVLVTLNALRLLGYKPSADGKG